MIKSNITNINDSWEKNRLSPFDSESQQSLTVEVSFGGIPSSS